MAGRGAAVEPTTYTIYSGAADGYVGATPWTAGDGGGDSVNNTTGSPTVGRLSGTGWGYESFLTFDTSIVVGTITSATLSIYVTNDTSNTDFTIEVRLHDWGTSLTTADWLSSETLGTKTLLASLSTDGLTVSAHNTFTSDAAFLSNINQAGETRVVVCSDRHRLGLTAPASEYMAFKGHDGIDAEKPKLVIEAA